MVKMLKRNTGRLVLFLLLLGTTLLVGAGRTTAPSFDMSAAQAYIVQGQDMAQASAAVLQVGGRITHELGIINAVGAQLTAAQRSALSNGNATIRVLDNHALEVATGALVQEAENAAFYGAFEVYQYSGASGGQYLGTSQDTGSFYNPSDPGVTANRAEFTFNIQTAGAYRLRGWIQTLDNGSDSFFYAIDGSALRTWHTFAHSTFGSEYAGEKSGSIDEFNLTTGAHTVVIYMREDGTRLDQLALELVGNNTDTEQGNNTDTEQGNNTDTEQIEQEAEDAARFGAFAVFDDAGVSGGQYLGTPEGSGSYYNPTDAAVSANRAEFTFNLQTAGTYRLRGWIQAPNSSSDSFYYAINGSALQAWHTFAHSTFGSEYAGEKSGSADEFNLAAGTHSVTIYLREDGTDLDKLALELVGSDPSTLIAENAVWKYLDNGADLGTEWKYPEYDDYGWAEGAAELGYGDGDEATVVGYGPDSNNKYITTYFRHNFNVANAASLSSLHLSMKRDDGMVVYLNGAEIYRGNMPDGAIAYDTMALSDSHNDNNIYEVTVPVTALTEGNNTLAVEVHQAALNSSDISFRLKMTGDATPIPHVLIDQSAVWQYLDNGSDQGTAWKEPGFNDSAWVAGQGELGYGDGDEATTVSYGGDGNNKYATTYFRHTFNVANAASLTGLKLAAKRDDGMVVYLNGTEVHRGNMPDGVITYDTWALKDDYNDNSVYEAALPASLLVEGANVIAVEVHQAKPTSSDISFRLVLTTDTEPDTIFPAYVQADQLHSANIQGSGITVAVVDTGYWSHPFLDRNSAGQDRVLAQYDAIMDQVREASLSTDDSGHGTHVTSLILSSGAGNSGKKQGVAPDANLVTVKAFNELGAGSYLDVIRGIDWVVTHKDEYNIRVLNLSFSAPPQSFYWDDPLNQAVMSAWEAGIVVVTAAGNTGPDPMTVGVPGNVPYVITVGALTDNYTPGDFSDDFLTSFSAAGPTVEGFVKPDVVAPGGHIMGIMPGDSYLATNYPTFRHVNDYFTMSGTSQATAVTSGIAALMLEANPALTPDDVKCRLMASARAAVDDNGSAAYSVFQQGAGVVNAYDAVAATTSGCANQGLDIALDLAGTQHYQGPANQDENGTFYLIGLEGSGFTWSGGNFWSGGFTWSGGNFWSGGFTWSGGNFWSGGFTWSGLFTWSGSIDWTAASSGTNLWVPQE